MTTINIGYSSKEKGEKFARAIEGKSYMNFHVEICPAGGDCNINVTTDYVAPVKEIREMLMYLMFCEIAK